MKPVLLVVRSASGVIELSKNLQSLLTRAPVRAARNFDKRVLETQPTRRNDVSPMKLVSIIVTPHSSNGTTSFNASESAAQYKPFWRFFDNSIPTQLVRFAR